MIKDREVNAMSYSSEYDLQGASIHAINLYNIA